MWRYNSQALAGADWTSPPSSPTIPVIHPSGWDVDNIGQVFGIALKNQGAEIYLAATDIYRLDAPYRQSLYGPGGSGCHL